MSGSDQPDGKAEPVSASKAPAIARAIAILRLLGRSAAPRGLQSIARELGLVPSTCLYVLRALVAEEFVSFDPDTKRYALDAGVLSLSRDWLRRDRFAERARPLLDRVALRFDVTALGVQVAGLDHITAVQVSRGTSGVQVGVEIGSRFPALISATGRCVAAFGGSDPARLEHRFAALRWDAAPTFDDWLGQVDETRRRGVAVDIGQYIAGVAVVAAPVYRGEGRLSHVVVALGLAGGMQRAGLREVEEEMLAVARVLTTLSAD